jgi:hypothetical protein
MDWTHTKKDYGKYQRPPYKGTLREAQREEDQTTVGEDQLSKKQGEVGMN